MDFEKKSGPEILMASNVKPIKDVPKRPEEKPAMIHELSTDELMEYAAMRLLVIPFDEKAYRKDDVYRNSYNVSFIKGMIAYAMLGFRDIGFPVEAFIQENAEKASSYLVRKRILGK
jgi:hypothetical protein